MNTLTDNQAKLLSYIAYDEYTQYNGARPDEPVECWLWVDEIAAATGLSQNQVKGVISRAQDADLIFVVDNGRGEDNAIGHDAERL